MRDTKIIVGQVIKIMVHGTKIVKAVKIVPRETCDKIDNVCDDHFRILVRGA